MHAETDFDDTPLQQATDALCNAPAAPGPSLRVVQDTLESLERSSRPPILARIGASVCRHRIAACILVPIPVAAVLLTVLIPSLSSARHAAAFGAVLNQIRSASTVQYRVTYSAPDRPGQAQRILSKGDRSRIEFDNGPIVISDLGSHRILTLMPDRKLAFLAPMPADTDSAEDGQSVLLLFAHVKDLQADPEAFRGLREENGHQLYEFQTHQKGAQFNILADPQTDRPVRITMTLPLFKVTMVTSDFVFDADLSDDLFSLTPPPGYTLTEQPDEGDGVIAADPVSGQGVVQTKVTMSDADFADPVEQDVIAYLRALAEFHGGQFPSADVFNNPTDARTAGLRDRMHQASLTERQTIAEDISRYFLKWYRSKAYFETVLAAQPDYVGDGVRQGQADRPVLAWPLPDGKQARIVYGDFSIKDVDPASLPLAAEVLRPEADKQTPKASPGK